MSTSVVMVEAPITGGVSQGSGVVVGDRQVVTNAHVVANALGLVTVRQGKSSWQAVVESTDSDHDIALLGIVLRREESFALRSATISRDRSVVGEHVYAVGAPLGLERTLSDGLISGMSPHLGMSLIQITCPISHGSSGGGLFDGNGRLLGITTMYLQESQNLNFAVPVHYIMRLQEQPVRRVEMLTTARATPPSPALAACMPAPENARATTIPTDLPTAISTLHAVRIVTESKGPVATAGGMTNEWLRSHVKARLQNRGIWVFDSVEEANRAKKLALPLFVEVGSMNIEDTVLYPWRLDLTLVDSTTFMNGTKGIVTIWAKNMYGFGGSNVVLGQISKSIDEMVDSLAEQMAH